MNQKQIVQVDDIMDLPASKFVDFVGAKCLVGVPSLAQAQNAMKIQLEHLPEDVRDRVVRQALIPELNQQGNVRSTVNHFDQHGSASTYMAVWSTTYSSPTLTGGGESYSTCYMVSGIEFEVAESVVDYETHTEKVYKGRDKCNCGIWYCDTCATYDTIIHKTPIFKKHVLSLKNQEDLNEWMVRQAISSAETTAFLRHKKF